MGCKVIPGGFACSRGQRAKPCDVAGCSRSSVALCDFPLQGLKTGRTCDRALCAYHRHTQDTPEMHYVGTKRGPADTTDYCPTHHETTKAGQP